MGLLDSVITTLRGGRPSPSGPQQVSLLPAVVEFINDYPGGLAGLLKKFRQDGLGEAVASWLSEEQNQPVSPDQLKSTLGDAAIEQLAQASGQTSEAVLGNLSALLPVLVDHVTPGGRLEPGQLDVMSLMGSVSGLLRKL